jgi:Uma2 family endonuclease
MSVLVHDPYVAARIKAERETTEASKYDEVWDGVYVMSPLPNVEHQFLATLLSEVFQSVLRPTGAGISYSGLNVSDREEGWLQNYREPDVAVILNGNPAKNCGTHYCGGPDLVVEIISPEDHARQKRDFYAKIGVREFWVLDRDPWALELYQLADGQLVLAGVSSSDSIHTLSSAVLPLTLRLRPGQGRPQIEIIRTDGHGEWLI